MKLYLSQKVFSLKDKSTVKDENGNVKYYIEGKVFSLGKKLTLFNSDMEEVAFVRQKVPSLLPKFFVEINGEQVALIKKAFTFLKPRYDIEGLDWTVGGDFLGHDYEIISGNDTIVTIHKRWMSWGDSYELNIKDESSEVLTLAVVLAIDAVLDAQQSAAAVSFSDN